MKARTRFRGRAAMIGLLMLCCGVTKLHSAVPPAFVKPKAVSHRMTEDECSTLALNATLAKARAEMRALHPGGSKDLPGITAAMLSDRRLAERIKRTFGNSDVVESEYSNRGECVVTYKVPARRPQLLARD